MISFLHKGETFYLDGKPFQIYSGAIHYFRIPRAYWRDRLLKLKECGFNTVETYVAWNMHEPHEGDFDFSENNDVAAFIRLAQELGLYAIVRPGPFICAEWEGGGLPAWLFADKNMRIRCNYVAYMQKVERYFERLFRELRPLLVENGGNILMMQVENEYGSYGNDKSYLRHLVDLYRKNGVEGLLFTADGAWINMLVKGTLPDYCLPFLTFGSNTETAMSCIDLVVKNVPKMCAEFWCGWFDHWGEEHHTRPTDDVVKELESFLNNGWNFNFYMFCGGTNFGFMNGANYDGKYLPTVTSYDYNGVLSEAGDRTELYYKIRDTFIRYGVSVPDLSAHESLKTAYGKVKLSDRVLLRDCLMQLSKPIHSCDILSMEDIGQSYGYIVYSTILPMGLESDWLLLDDVGDRAIVFIDGEKSGVYDRNDSSSKYLVDTINKQKRIDVLVENRGRINYGIKIYDRKGLGGIRHSMTRLFGWDIYPLPMDNLGTLAFDNVFKQSTDKPIFCGGTLSIVDEPQDTFVEIIGANRGFIEVNGHNIGRFNYDEGPQKTLYIPAPFLRKGDNRIVVFSSDGAETTVTAVFKDKPEL